MLVLRQNDKAGEWMMRQERSELAGGQSSVKLRVVVECLDWPATLVNANQAYSENDICM